MDSNRLEYNITYLICACTFENPLPITMCDQVVRPLIWRRGSSMLGSSMLLRHLGPQGEGWSMTAWSIPTTRTLRLAMFPSSSRARGPRISSMKTLGLWLSAGGGWTGETLLNSYSSSSRHNTVFNSHP